MLHKYNKEKANSILKIAHFIFKKLFSFRKNLCGQKINDEILHYYNKEMEDRILKIAHLPSDWLIYK